MNVIRSLTWALYNRFLSTIGFALGLAIAGASIMQWGQPAAQAVLDGAAPQSVATQAAMGAGGVGVGFYVWRLASSVAFYRTVIGATEQRIKKHSGTAQVKSQLTEQFDEHFDELQSDLRQTRKMVQDETYFDEVKGEIEEIRETVEELEAAIEHGDRDTDGASDGDPPNHHETIPDSTGTEERPEASAHRRVADSDSGRSVPVPGRSGTDGSSATDASGGFGSSDGSSATAGDDGRFGTDEDDDHGSFGSAGSQDDD
jgi:hypothetical protein